VLGDLAQSTAPAAVGSWPGMLAQLGKPGAEVRVLETGYRVPRQILDYANQLLGALAPGLAPASSLRQDPAALTVLPATSQSLPGALATACAAAQQAAESTAVIVADDQVAALSGQLGAAQLAHRVLDGRHPDPGDGGRLVVPVTLAKGLEFDQRHRRRAGPYRGRRTAWPAPALRRAHPRGVPAHRAAQRATARRAGLTTALSART
jgi:DNA helicase IV